MNALRKKDTVEANPIGLPKDTAKKIGEQLDHHVASMFVLFHQYQKHHWLVEGPHFRDLHLYLEASYNGVHKELDAIAERMTVLGGIPTCAPRAQAELSYLEHEPEGYFPIRESLRRDMEAEATLAQRLRETIRQANQLGDFGTETLLKQTLYAAEDRAHHLEHYLAEDSLEEGRCK